MSGGPARPRRLRVALCAGLLLASCQTGRSDPSPSSDARAVGEADLRVVLDRNGVVEIHGKRLLLDDDVALVFASFRERSPKGTIIFFAHRATLHGRLSRMVDLAKEASAPFDVVVED